MDKLSELDTFESKKKNDAIFHIFDLIKVSKMIKL